MPFWVAAAFAVKILAVAAITFLLLQSIDQRARDAALATHTLEALDRLELVLGLLRDAETGQRGYLITGDDRYLEPFDTARASLPGALSSLRESVAVSPTQRQQIGVLEGLVGAKMAELGQTVDLKRTGNIDAALAVVRTDRGRATMDAVRDAVRQMQTEERASLQRSRDDAAAGTLREITLAGSALLLVLIGASIFTNARAFRDLEVHSWVRAGQNLLGARMQGTQRLEDLGDRIASSLAQVLDAAVAAVVVKDDDGAFVPCGGYALPEGRVTNGSAGSTGALVREAAKERRILHVSDVPDDYLPVTSSLGKARPRHLLLVPAAVDGETNAIVELGFFRDVGGPEKELLDRAAEPVGLAVRAAQDRARQARLLEQTQRQAQALQAQQEELKTANEELEEQTRGLRSAQAELEESNVQLEEQATALESQKEAMAAAQRQLQQRSADVERASRYKSEFLANMSHELRTPLNSSLILARLLIDNKEGNLTREQVRYAESIYTAGNDLLTLINDILDLAKIEAGRVDLALEQVPVAGVLESLKRRFEPIAAEKKLALRFTVEPGCPETIRSDPNRLRQVLTNLLSNALKFTEQGSVEVRASAADAQRIAFTVADTGIGIPEEQHDAVFEAFRQADGTTARRYGGTGLGLSISRELATLLGGEIRLRSAPGQGSAFTVVLPTRAESTAVPGASAPKLERRSAPAIARGPATPLVADDRDRITDPRRVVLIVEDDAPFAEILRDLGRELAFQCVVARDGAEGLELARRYAPVAVLLDIGLPDQSGLSVLELLKRDPSTRHVPIHVVSVHDYEKVARELGAVGYALKPVKREQLVAAFRLLEERLSRKVKSVLVVEDDAAQRDAVARLLRADDVNVVAVATAEEGLAQLRSATFDCCVLDLLLPGVSGLELLERMSRDEACSFPPVIVYTARPLDGDEEQKLRRLSSSIIVKGARSPERLLEEVTLFLHQVEAELPPDRQRMLQAARDRERVFDGRRILLVEDDVRNVFALTRVLEQKGLAVEIARTGKEALARMAGAADVDLVLMDIMMPEMDGLAAMRAIRREDRWASVPIIALTAKAMPDDRSACLEAGANDYIAKPIDVEKLMSLLRVWMPR